MDKAAITYKNITASVVGSFYRTSHHVVICSTNDIGSFLSKTGESDLSTLKQNRQVNDGICKRGNYLRSSLSTCEHVVLDVLNKNRKPCMLKMYKGNVIIQPI